MTNSTGSQEQLVVAVYPTHTEAESGIKALATDGFNMKKLSIMGQDYHTEEHVVGYYTTGERVLAWGSQGAFWGGVFGLLFGTAIFIVPGVGPVLLAGPAVAWFVAALEGAVVVGGLSALGGALYSVGLPKDSIIEYESAIRAGHFVVVANGTPAEAARARDILHTDARQFDMAVPVPQADTTGGCCGDALQPVAFADRVHV